MAKRKATPEQLAALAEARATRRRRIITGAKVAAGAAVAVGGFFLVRRGARNLCKSGSALGFLARATGVCPGAPSAPLFETAAERRRARRGFIFSRVTPRGTFASPSEAQASGFARVRAERAAGARSRSFFGAGTPLLQRQIVGTVSPRVSFIRAEQQRAVTRERLRPLVGQRLAVEMSKFASGRGRGQRALISTRAGRRSAGGTIGRFASLARDRIARAFR